jgi:hypothetical protein
MAIVTRRATLACLLIGLACLSSVPVAGAASEWSAPVTVSRAARGLGSPDVAIDPQGDAVAVWEGSGGAIESAFKLAGSDWQSPTTLPSAVQGVFHPQVALDGAGNAVAVWDAWLGGEETVIQSSSRPAGGTWSAPVDLSGTTERATNAELAMNERGEAAVVWQAEPSASTVVEVARRSALGLWGPAEEVSGSVFGYTPEAQVSIDAQGDIGVAWVKTETSEGVVEATVKQAGTGWLPPTQMPGQIGYGAAEPRLAMGPNREATLTWVRQTFGSRSALSSIRTFGGLWSSPIEQSEFGKEAYGLTVAAHPGYGILAWEMWRYGYFDIQASLANGRAVTVARHAEAPRIAALPGEGSVAVWRNEGNEGESPSIAGAFDPTGAIQGFRLSEPSEGFVQTPELAVNAAGEAVAAWLVGSGPEEEKLVRAAALQPPPAPVTPVAPAPVAPSSSPSAPPAPPSPAPKARPVVVVRLGPVEGSALGLTLRCPGTGTCRGNVKILAPRRPAAKADRGKAKKFVYLTGGAFSIRPGKTKVLRLRLTGPALQALDAAPRHRLKVNVVGRDVRPRALVLTAIR